MGDFNGGHQWDFNGSLCSSVRRQEGQMTKLVTGGLRVNNSNLSRIGMKVSCF